MIGMRIILLLLASGAFTLGRLHGQGCSDAGFCTIGSLGQHSKNVSEEKRHKLSFMTGNGIGDENVYVFTPAIQYDYRLNKSWALQSKITANYANGNLGSAAGAGDLFMSATFDIRIKDKWRTSLLLGTKIPLNNGDIHAGGKPLPMQYQSSLGTADLLAGITISDSRWHFSAALQQPFTGQNGNTFLPEYRDTEQAYKYSPSNDFNRKGDVLIKAGYGLIMRKGIHFNVGLLGIYHLGDDTYINANISNNPIELAGSKGLTLNATAALHYELSNKVSLGFSGGIPFVVREVRPDGLTRKFVLSPEIAFKF